MFLFKEKAHTTVVYGIVIMSGFPGKVTVNGQNPKATMPQGWLHLGSEFAPPNCETLPTLVPRKGLLRHGVERSINKGETNADTL